MQSSRPIREYYASAWSYVCGYCVQLLHVAFVCCYRRYYTSVYASVWIRSSFNVAARIELTTPWSRTFFRLLWAFAFQLPTPSSLFALCLLHFPCPPQPIRSSHYRQTSSCPSPPHLYSHGLLRHVPSHMYELDAPNGIITAKSTTTGW